MTLAELIADSAQQLSQAGVHFGQGTLNATDEAAWLVLWQLGLPLDTALDEETGQLSAQDLAKARALIARRIETRQPAAYLTGEAWLQGVPFHVDARSIIPRSLIAEVLAEGYLDEWLPPGAPRIMDLCTGNGSLLCWLPWPGQRRWYKGWICLRKPWSWPSATSSGTNCKRESNCWHPMALPKRLAVTT